MLDLEKIKDLYLVQYKTMNDIARMYNLTKRQIKAYFTKNNIPIRKRGRIFENGVPLIYQGLKYRLLTILDSFEEDVNCRGERVVRVACKCECGNTIFVNIAELRKGSVISCGCLNHAIGPKNKGYKGYGEIGRTYWNSIYNRRKNHDFDITIEYVWDLFLKQDRKCALSGLPLVFMGYKAAKKTGIEQTASLDRIDSSKGYTKDNVQWVHKYINIMKQDHTDKEFIELCRLVTQHNPILPETPPDM